MAIVIRPATPADLPAIARVHTGAFAPSTTEAALVAALYAADAWVVSLVACVGEEVVGHILFSPVACAPPTPGMRGVGLAPLGVLPAWQKQGVGSALVREGLKVVQQQGATFAVVLGDPAFYSRFGFQRASTFGMQNEFGVDDAFMVMWFTTPRRSPCHIQYHPAFAKV